MARKTGISLLSSNNLNMGIPMQGLQLDSLIQAVRVKSIVLDENHPRFEELGEWNALGVIEFEYVNNPVDSQTYPVAFPFNPNTKNYPLINEIVYLLSLPDTSIGDFTSGAKSYYIDVVSIWNHPHHNAYPTQPGELPNSQQKDYTETQAGSVRRVTDQSTEINLGNTFTERSNIHPILPFEGDRIIEGRWGQSIRFGSTNIKTSGNSKTANKSNAFGASETFTLGNTNPTTLRHQLSVASARVKQFSDKYDNVIVVTSVNASESQVTNPNNIPSGGLAQQRLDNTLSILSSFPLLNKDIRSNTSIGSTPYTPGVDNPNNPKYTSEQSVNINISVRGTEIIDEPENGTPLNDWSTTGKSGDPITVLRNGQGEQTEEGWIPVIENINNDDSSIYLTSTQQIPLEVSNESYKSYTSPPENLDKYQGKQIILNSGRLVFSSNDDHILFNTPNSFGVNANSFNIDSSKSIIQSNEIYLGSKDATEPILKGDTTIDLISQLIDQLINLNIALKSVTPTGGPAVAPAAITLEPFLRKLKTQFQTLTKSKISKTL